MFDTFSPIFVANTKTILSYNFGASLKVDSRSDDLTVFKCLRVIFSLKKQAIQFSFSFNLYFQQK